MTKGKGGPPEPLTTKYWEEVENDHLTIRMHSVAYDRCCRVRCVEYRLLADNSYAPFLRGTPCRIVVSDK